MANRDGGKTLTYPGSSRGPRQGSVRRTGVAAVLFLALPVTQAAASVQTSEEPAGRDDCVLPGESFAPEPWPQTLWDLPAAAAQTRGSGVTIAVLSSGVDAQQAQLSGRVARGRSFATDVVGDSPGDVDCAGLGTGLASLLVAQPIEDAGLEGLAPDAVVLPVVVSESPWFANPEDDSSGTAAGLAAAIRYSVEAEADIVLVGGYLAQDDAEVREAVADASAAGVLVVAPVRDSSSGFEGPAFPAAYDGVLGVAAMAQDLTVLPGSETGPAVDLVAPGDNVAVAARVRGHAVAEGNAPAAAFAAGAAALVIATSPDLDPAGVIARLKRTAGPIGNEDPDLVGAGLLDVTRAVTEGAAEDQAPESQLQGMGDVDAAALAAAEEERARVRAASAVAAGALVVALLIWMAAWTGRRGRRDGWRLGRRVLPAPAAPADGVPRPLFDRSGSI